MSYATQSSVDVPFRQRVFDFVKSYEEGYATGAEWNNNWIPGGPFVFSNRLNDHPDWIAYCEKSKRKHDEWMRGFREAREHMNICQILRHS